MRLRLLLLVSDAVSCLCLEPNSTLPQKLFSFTFALFPSFFPVCLVWGNKKTKNVNSRVLRAWRVADQVFCRPLLVCESYLNPILVGKEKLCCFFSSYLSLFFFFFNVCIYVLCVCYTYPTGSCNIAFSSGLSILPVHPPLLSFPHNLSTRIREYYMLTLSPVTALCNVVCNLALIS